MTNNYYGISYSSDYLSHHGIKGQKWGVRRYQNEDGSLTEAGQLRYNTQEAKKRVKDTKKEIIRLKMKSNFNSEKIEKYRDATRENRNARRYLQKAKLREKALTQKNVSERQKKYENEYKLKGLSDEDAKMAAYKKIHTERALLAVGGVAVASVAAYGTYRYVMANKDRIIKPGTILQNISTDSNKGVEDAFYASRSKLANTKYIGQYGAQLRIQEKVLYGSAADKISKMNATVGESGLKVASEKSATKVLKELSEKDANFNKDMILKLKKAHQQLETIPGAKLQPANSLTLKRGIKALEKGKVNSSVYKAFNASIPVHSSDENTTDKVYEALRNKGYGAIQDVTDRIGGASKYNVADPLIVFGGSKSLTNVTNKSVKDTEVALKWIGTAGVSSVAASVATKKAQDKITLSLTQKNDKIITEYKKEHPNTKLSDYKILSNYKKNHS